MNRFLVVLFLSFLLPVTAHAQCAMPSGPPVEAGVIVFNTDHKVMQYCNGDKWIGLWGGKGGGTNLPDCSDSEIMQWSGDAWTCNNGSGLDNLDASNLKSGTVPHARLGSGTADNTTFLRGDGQWAAPSGGGGCDPVNEQVFTASGTWVKPNCGAVAFVQCWGGGGGGGGYQHSKYGGGGGGYFGQQILLSQLAASVPVIIGAGGAGHTNNGAGVNGGNSSFGGLVAEGGQAGYWGTYALGGKGGSNSFGDAGGVGGEWPHPYVVGGHAGYGGGGGGYGSNLGIGGNSAYGGGGGGGGHHFAQEAINAGGSSIFGGNGGSGGRNTPGGNGQIPGGGGGGGGGNGFASGNGARGECRVLTW